MLWNKIHGAGGFVGGDPYWSDVQVLLHLDGSDGSTTFTNDGNSSQTFSAFGSAEIDTAQSKFGGASGLLPNTAASAIFCGYAPELTLGSGDYTIEFWWYAATGNTDTYEYPLRIRNAANNYLSLRASNAGFGYRLQLEWDGGTLGDAVAFQIQKSALQGVWSHVAVAADSGTMRLFVGGTEYAVDTTTSATGTSSQRTITGDCRVQLGINSGNDVQIDDFRYTTGVARYTSNFTPPTAPFPNT